MGRRTTRHRAGGNTVNYDSFDTEVLADILGNDLLSNVRYVFMSSVTELQAGSHRPPEFELFS
jgi:hypothetical protein